jgi:hypothetical protein
MARIVEGESRWTTDGMKNEKAGRRTTRAVMRNDGRVHKANERAMGCVAEKWKRGNTVEWA